MKYSSPIFPENIRAYQVYVLNYGKCPLCDRGLSQGENVYVGYLSDDSLAVACESCRGVLKKDIRRFTFHPQEYEVPSKETMLWRYLDFPKFVSLLDSGQLFFTRADMFEDIFEGARGFNYQKTMIYESTKPVLSLKAKKNFSSNGIDNPLDIDIEKKVEEEIAKLVETQEQKRKDYYVSCWHANNLESEAMWKLYITAKKQGVAIQTTMERLCCSIGEEGFDIGRINYISYENPLEISNIPIWYKRTAFQHENEVRVVFKQTGTDVNGLSIPVNLDLLIENIYISPSAPSWFAKLVENILIKYGLNKKVEHSKLDEKPIY